MNEKSRHQAGSSPNISSRIIRLLQDAAARVVYIEEALQDGDTGTAFTVARDLELDLRSAIADYEVAA
jgi:hypothetical protein